jgi:hypothetical protein
MVEEKVQAACHSSFGRPNGVAQACGGGNDRRGAHRVLQGARRRTRCRELLCECSLVTLRPA